MPGSGPGKGCLTSQWLKPPSLLPRTGISRDNWHKRRKTGGKRKPYHKKRKYELGRPAANTKVRAGASPSGGAPGPGLRGAALRVAVESPRGPGVFGDCAASSRSPAGRVLKGLRGDVLCVRWD